MLREQLYVPTFSIPLTYVVFVRQRKTDWDNLEDSIIDDVRDIDADGATSENWTGSTRFRILNKRPFEGYSWVGGRLTKTQVTSRRETISSEVWLQNVQMCADFQPKC